ncbi:hybrid sensor histidine kinase/response regulator [Vulgatibacter incomptus]|uniref:histidine kinase n=1 Tax=Vulgatibacter incomptus TaxID=1391653 RepID=A0A0K1PFX4_9BACT|nr:response regulator [Vulgatibacter incomptus]AKU92407.1 Signal transduction histidine kinase CheA [Vulgatibacter incomptus]
MSAEEIRKKLLGKFREVTADRVERLEAALVAIEASNDAEAARELSRELHTLKGEARMMGFAGVSTLVHTAEELIASVGGELPSLAGVLRRACGSIPALLELPSDAEEARGLQAELASLVAKRSNEAATTPVAGVEAALPAGASGPLAPSASRADSSAKTVGSPAGAAATPGPATGSPAEASATSGSAAAPAEGAVTSSAAKSAAPTNPSQAAGLSLLSQASSIRVDLDSLDEIAGLAGDVLVEGAKAQARVSEQREILEAWPRLAERLLALAEKGIAGDALDDAETEFHRLRNRTFRFFHHHTEALGGTQSLLSNLAEKISTARMTPLDEVFSGLVGASKRLGADHGKELECVVTGGDTSIDRAIIPSLNDPLIHLLRNSIDHGLELREQRLAAGKPPVGRITIAAKPDGDRLRVEVSDDGRGIDAGFIRDVARRRGIVSDLEAAQLSNRAAIDLIFAAGFSTLDSSSETSGRGVGLDVVRQRVVALGGTVEVETRLGIGTTFILTMPQSLSMMKVLLFRIDDDVYGVPAGDVESVGRIEPARVTEIAGIRAISHRERLVPIVALGPLLSLNGGPSGSRPMAVFLQLGEHRVALAIDGIFGQREVAVKAPSTFIKGMPFVSGGAALEDGRVALLLSTPELVTAARAFGNPTSSTARRRLKVLLVDDSLIAREAEAAILRTFGHEVTEAGDGEEGWQKLQSGSFDLLVTDVQMPVLDGIELTRRVKSSERFRKLPVAIVSSLSATRDRRRGAEAGADAFLSKGDLDGDLLAETIERLCGVVG